MLNSSEFSGVRSTSENYDVFNSLNEIYLVFTEKGKFSFYFLLFIDYMQCLTKKKEVLKMQNRKFLANPNNFDTKIFVKMHPTLQLGLH